MNTSKPISTISFNSDSFLFSKCNELTNNNIISFFAYIKHYGEPTKSKDILKDHFHLYIEPNKRIDTMSLQKEFEEIFSGYELPLKCLPFNSSKFDDWYFYVLHDPIYLARKGMTRNYFYNRTDILTSDKDYLTDKINSINLHEFNSYIDIAEYQNKGYSFSQYLIAKNISPMQIKAYSTAWAMVEELNHKSTHNKKEASDKSHLQSIEENNIYSLEIL